MPRLVIAGTHSGVGKTTIVTGLLAALHRQGVAVQPFKVGPDYIDPGFHRLASGRMSYNLDTWLVPPDRLAAAFTRLCDGAALALVEGVMGLYDGGRGGVSSTAAIARLLRAPVVLVVDVRSMGESVAAVVLGYQQYDRAVQLAGVILNRVGSATHANMVRAAVERLGVPVLGCVPRQAGLEMPERHLGLVPTTEFAADAVLHDLAAAVEQYVDVARLRTLAAAAPPLPEPPPAQKPAGKPVTIAVARDAAFSFYYPDSLQVLVDLGAVLVYFSPLRDQVLPPCDGVILGGGFPEMFLPQLAANRSLQERLRRACAGGMPVYAECGGLMYLCRRIVAFDGQAYDMAGLVPAVCRMERRLAAVGYVTAAARQDNVLCQQGEVLAGHEFHFSTFQPEIDEAAFPWAFMFTRVRTGDTYVGGYAHGRLLASYLHLHFAGQPAAAARFIASCRAYQQETRCGVVIDDGR